VVLLTQDGDQNLLIPSNTVEVSGFASSFKLLHAINPLLLSTGKIKGKILTLSSLNFAKNKKQK